MKRKSPPQNNKKTLFDLCKTGTAANCTDAREHDLELRRIAERLLNQPHPNWELHKLGMKVCAKTASKAEHKKFDEMIEVHLASKCTDEVVVYKSEADAMRVRALMSEISCTAAAMKGHEEQLRLLVQSAAAGKKTQAKSKAIKKEQRDLWKQYRSGKMDGTADKNNRPQNFSKLTRKALFDEFCRLHQRKWGWGTKKLKANLAGLNYRPVNIE